MLDFFKGTVTPKDWAFVAAILAVAGIIIAALYFFLYQPKVQAVAAQQTDLDAILVELREAREIKSNIETLREEAQKWEELVGLFQQRLPEAREIPSLLQKFEQMGAEIGLRLELSQLPTSRDDNKETIPYRVVARGNFHQVVEFINMLEREQRYLKISDLDIGEEEAGVSEASFTLSTFRFLQEETTAKTPQPETPADGQKP
jgi:type IV pilus assembly protein PilO